MLNSSTHRGGSAAANTYLVMTVSRSAAGSRLESGMSPSDLLGKEGQRERVSRLCVGFERFQDPEFGFAGAARDLAGKRDVDAAFEFPCFRGELVAESLEEVREPGAAALQASGGAGCAAEFPRHLVIGAAQLLDRFVGRLGERRPLGKQLAQVAFQDGVNVVLGVELVFVGDAGERHRSPPRNTAATRM